MSLLALKSDMLELISLSAEIAKYSEQLLHHSDIEDKRNYDAEKCERIKKYISKMQDRFYNIKEKWF